MTEKQRKKRDSEKHIELYNWYKENGICVDCRKVFSIPGRVRCKACADKNAKKQQLKRDKLIIYKRNLRMSRIEAGLCVQCGKKPPLEGRRLCKRCNEMNNDSSKKYKWKKRMERQSWVK